MLAIRWPSFSKVSASRSSVCLPTCDVGGAGGGGAKWEAYLELAYLELEGIKHVRDAGGEGTWLVVRIRIRVRVRVGVSGQGQDQG